MSENEILTKNCIKCYEIIDKRAEKCPRCHEWQAGFFSMKNPYFTNIFGAIFGVLIGLFFLRLFLVPNFNDEKRPINFNDKISVVRKEFFYTQENGVPIIIVMGTLKNISDKKLRYIKIEVDFFDSERKLIDTLADTTYDFVLLADSETNFKIRGTAVQPKEKYASFDVKIKWAQTSQFF